MGVLYDIRRYLRRAIAPCLCFCAVIYFGYHTVQGERGVIAYLRLGAGLERSEMALEQSTQERQALEARVALLRPDNLDRDMLDERARHILGLAHPHDLVVYPEN